jgi:uncharacterized iron-regulated membrane protein
MRRVLSLAHRWFGLGAAAFLFAAGLTGAVISWDHELDEWLNPHLYRANVTEVVSSPLELANQLEASNDALLVTYLPLAVEPGRALQVSVEPRTEDATLAINQIALDPATGAIQGERMWGEASLSRENLLPFLYKLHYSMHIPDYRGIETGVWFMGIVGIFWVIDCFVALSISFPSRRTWRKSLSIRARQGGFKLWFDLHRSGGVWVWLLVGLLAVTSVSMNLGTEVVRPIVNRLSPLSPSPFDSRAEARTATPKLSREAIVARAIADAPTHGIHLPAGAVFYSPAYNVYGVGFFTPGKAHGDGGLGNPWLYYDGETGAAAGAEVPGSGSAGDIFMQAQFPLHSGRIAGVPGRILVSLMGLVVAGLSVTGVVIWARKRASRRMAAVDDATALASVSIRYARRA